MITPTRTVPTPTVAARFSRRWALLLFAGLLLTANSGCLLIAAGAAGGAAAGIAYAKGKVCATYFAGPRDVWAATKQGLTELEMPIKNEVFNGVNGSLESKNACGDRIFITMEPASSGSSVDGVFTRLCIRVATFGDRRISERIFQQIGSHLAMPMPPGTLAPIGMQGGDRPNFTPVGVAATAANPMGMGAVSPSAVPAGAGSGPISLANFIVPQGTSAAPLTPGEAGQQTVILMPAGTTAQPPLAGSASESSPQGSTAPPQFAAPTPAAGANVPILPQMPEPVVQPGGKR